MSAGTSTASDPATLWDRVLNGDVAAAEEYAVGQVTDAEWLVLSAALVAVQQPWVWVRFGGRPEGSIAYDKDGKPCAPVLVGRTTYAAPFGGWDITSAVIKAAQQRAHLAAAPAVADFLATAKAEGGFLGAVGVAMRANRKGGWSLWKETHTTTLINLHHDAFVKRLKSRDVNEPERTAWSRHAQKEGVGSCAVELIEHATRKGVLASDMTVESVIAAMHAEIAENQARNLVYSKLPDPRWPKVLSLMDRYKTGLQVEATWRLRRRKRIEDHLNEIKAKAEAGTLPPITGGVR